jgi:phosphonate transport system permease protein
MSSALFPGAQGSPQVRALAAGYAAAQAEKRRRLALGAALLLLAVAASLWMVRFDAALLWERGGHFFGYFDRLLTLEGGDRAGQRVWMDPAEWFWGWPRWLRQLADTLLMAAVGTMLGFAFGAVLSGLAADNLAVSGAVRFAAKRVLEFCRTVPEIVFALIFVIAFGLGPLPGVLAIILHTTGALGKQFTEVVENIDMKPVEGVQAAGGGWAASVLFAAWPQVAANFASYGLLRFEINVRGAAVLGFVGAGGIGQDLIEAIRKFYYNDVAALLVLIIATVMVIDMLTSRLRRRLTEGA